MGRINTKKTRASRLSGPRNLLRAWPEVSQRMYSAARIALFADFDGTLTPIRRLPAQVRLGRAARRLLKLLAKRPITLGIVSGRAISDVRARVGVKDIWYVGAHGFSIEGPGSESAVIASERAIARMKLVHRELSTALGKMPGILVESKEATIAVHYRTASPAARDAARRIIHGLLDSYTGLHLLSGKKVWELLPNARTSKWTAIQHILKQERRGHPGRWLVIYLGDDATDERVFESMDGLSVAVGYRRPTAARYFLRTPEEVRIFFKLLMEVV